MVTKIMKWVSIMALLLAVTWRPSVNYQIPLDFLVCAGAVLVVLTLFIFHQTRNQDLAYGVDNRSNPARRVTVRL